MTTDVLTKGLPIEGGDRPDIRADAEAIGQAIRHGQAREGREAETADGEEMVG